MGAEENIMRLGRRDLRYVRQAGVYVLTKRRSGGRARLVSIGESENIGRDAAIGDGDFALAQREAVEEAIVVIERDPEARRRLTLAVAAAFAWRP